MRFIVLLYLSLLCYIVYCSRNHTQRMQRRVSVNRAPNFVFGTRGGSFSFGCFRAGLSGAKIAFFKSFCHPAVFASLGRIGAGLSDNDTSNMFIEVK